MAVLVKEKKIKHIVYSGVSIYSERPQIQKCMISMWPGFIEITSCDVSSAIPLYS